MYAGKASNGDFERSLVLAVDLTSDYLDIPQQRHFTEVLARTVYTHS